MKKVFSTFILCILCTGQTVFAATPLKNYMEIKDERHLFIKTYEAAPGEDPSLLKEKPFVLDGFSYSFFTMDKEEVSQEEKRVEKHTETITTQNNDVSTILQQLKPEIDYSNEGFTGKLLLNTESMQTQVDGYTTKTYTLTDTITIMELSNNDPSNVPKSTVKDGVTLKLTGVDWIVQDANAIDYNSIPSKYTAVASYSGSYTRNIPRGYITTVEYSGEVVKRQVDKVLYTVTYLGQKLPEAPSTVLPKEENSTWWIAGVVSALVLIGGSIVLFLVFFYNTSIYIKNADEYRLIAKRRIKWNNPIVDIRKLDVSGKEVAINVKKQMTKKLFGRQIKTLADGDYAIFCLVDKQGCDFWYVLNIPAENECNNTTN